MLHAIYDTLLCMRQSIVLQDITFHCLSTCFAFQSILPYLNWFSKYDTNFSYEKNNLLIPTMPYWVTWAQFQLQHEDKSVPKFNTVATVFQRTLCTVKEPSTLLMALKLWFPAVISIFLVAFYSHCCGAVTDCNKLSKGLDRSKPLNIRYSISGQSAAACMAAVHTKTWLLDSNSLSSPHQRFERPHNTAA